MRNNLAGTSYKTSSGGVGSTTGCGTNAAAVVAAGGSLGKCHGYELMVDLDFTDKTCDRLQQAAWDPVVQKAKGRR